MTDDTQSAEFDGPVPAEAGGPVGLAADAKRGTMLGRAWRRYRAWRRSRPFWAGIWLIIAGAELLLIPLPIHSMGVILHIGIGGISGILIGAVLIVLGLLLWVHPAQRLFYSIVAVLLAIAALVASNLGGFLLGTILGIIGASLGFAWTPLPPGSTPRRLLRRRGPATPDDTTIDVMSPSIEEAQGSDSGAADADALAEDSADVASDAAPATATSVTTAESDRGRLDPNRGAAGSGGGTAGLRRTTGYAEAGSRAARRYGQSAPYYRISPGRGTLIGGNIFAILVSALTFGLLNLSPTPSPTPATDPPVAAATPDPSASAAASPSPSASPAPSASASPAASPSSAPSSGASTGGGSSSAGAGPSPSPSPTPTGTPPPFAVATAKSTLTASSASITGFLYNGVVSVPTASGSQQMMEFSATSIDLTSAQLDVTAPSGATVTTTAATLDFSGNVLLYATELSGDLLGIPTTLTPGNAVSTILQILGQLGLTQSLTQAIPLTLTNVTTQQPYIAANGLTAGALQIS